MNKKILIIEDDPDIIDLLKIHLKDIDFSLDNARDGEQGLEKALNNDYELVILDLMLPGLDGLEVCRGIREKKKTLPILMLTAKAEEFDKVLGLELGADDYITKPFSIRELMARIKAVLRRISALRENGKNRQEDKELVFDQLSINLAKRRVMLNNKTIDLTAKEFDLLVTFASNPGRAFTRENLLNTVWGYQFSGYDHTVNSHINRLRAKIEKDPSKPRYIKTVWGVGYKFAELEDLEK
jgi:two-component system, OmpR family, alkaline phosphatase synthesis response regulator PhoP